MENVSEITHLSEVLDLPELTVSNLAQLAGQQQKTLKNYIKEILVDAAGKNQPSGPLSGSPA